MNFFSKFVDFPVISDDSGLCIKSLKNTPGVYSARLAKEKGGFHNAMKYILKKLKLKKIVMKPIKLTNKTKEKDKEVLEHER